MRNISKIATQFSVLVGLLLLAGCGPSTFTKSSMVYEPYAPNEWLQIKDGITVELKHVERFPQTFYANLQACDQYGRAIINSDGNPVMESVSLANNATQYWEQLAITNNTNNVIRMNGVVIRLFDPAANQYEVQSFDDVIANLYAIRPCSSTSLAANQFRVNKIFSRNMELVPGTTTTFWVPFFPASKNMEGVWKFAIYDVPVQLDAAGNPLRKTRFEMRVIAKQVTSTYSRANPFAQPELIGTTGGSAQPQPAAASTTYQTPSAAPAVSDRDMLARAQAKLNQLGYNAGPVDGIAGRKTSEAISNFQRNNGLPVTGRLDDATIRALGL